MPPSKHRKNHITHQSNWILHMNREKSQRPNGNALMAYIASASFFLVGVFAYIILK